MKRGLAILTVLTALVIPASAVAGPCQHATCHTALVATSTPQRWHSVKLAVSATDTLGVVYPGHRVHARGGICWGIYTSGRLRVREQLCRTNSRVRLDYWVTSGPAIRFRYHYRVHPWFVGVAQ